MVKAFDSGERFSEGFSAAYINVTSDAAGGSGIERVYPSKCVLVPPSGFYRALGFSVPDDALYDPGTTDFTVEGWLRVDSHDTTGALIAVKDDGISGGAGWRFGIDNAGYVLGRIRDGVNSYTATGVTVYPKNTLVHIAMVVKRSTNQMYLYVNGTATPASPYNIAAVTGSLNNSEAVKLAQSGDLTYFNIYAFRDIRFWNIARTAAEIADNRWRIFTSIPTNLKGYWLCNEGDGLTLNDSSGNAKHATSDYTYGGDVGQIWSYFETTRMHVFEIHGDAVYAVTSPKIWWEGTGGLTSGQIWTYNAGDSSGDRWFDLMQTGTQTVNAMFETATFDASRDIQGKWTSAPEITLFGAAVASTTLRLAPEATPGVFTDYPATEAVNAIARYMRYRVEETSLLSAAGMLVRLPCQVSFQGRIVEDTQEVSVTANPTAVVWAEPFSAIPQISLTLVGTAARILASNNLSKTGVDLHAWDAAGVAATATVRVTARGP
jgi:hypothetical protein